MLAPTALLCLAIALAGGEAAAQQKQQVSVKVPAENNKYGPQQNIQVGDVPNHIVRVFEVHSTFPASAPSINGLKLVEAWQRGLADVSDGAGSTSSYYIYAVENGDKFFVRSAAVIQPGTAGKLTATAVGHITGGTGKLAGIQGTARTFANFDPITGTLGENEANIEYTMGK
jgi:hypothetical protein